MIFYTNRACLLNRFVANAPKSKGVPTHHQAVFQTEILTLKKSRFMAHARHVHSEGEALQFLEELRTTNKRIADATHNIVAYRIEEEAKKEGENPAGLSHCDKKSFETRARTKKQQQKHKAQPNQTQFEELVTTTTTANQNRTSSTMMMIERRDDDGESGAGDQVLSLLRRHHIVNVIVVVTRWYGGIHLGADRFKMVNQAAKQVLQDMSLI